jgi:CRISPR system Cascade subunit CasE
MRAIAEYSGGLIHVHSALFEGRLMVTDVEQFKKALETGIGHGKVMSLGMLSIIPVHP